jgi:hypothetical protein
MRPRCSPQTKDSLLGEIAAIEGWILLTEDKDFGEIVYRDMRHNLGVVLIRIAPSRWQLKWPRLQSAIADYGDALGTSFTVLDEVRTRSQPLGRG